MYIPLTPNLGFPRVEAVLDALPRGVVVGTRFWAVDPTYGPGEFIILKGVASTVRGSVVLMAPDDWTSSLATANDKGKLACAMAAVVANKFGCYQIYGKGVAKVLAAFADNGDCYLTGTPGSVDDADVAGDFIRGMKGASAIDTPVTGLAEVELGYPEVQDGADN